MSPAGKDCSLNCHVIWPIPHVGKTTIQGCPVALMTNNAGKNSSLNSLVIYMTTNVGETIIPKILENILRSREML